ncbi:MAG: DUF6173 family protein [Roseburia sp.]
MDFKPYVPAFVPPPKPPIAYSYSDTQFEILKEQIEEFESTLDSEHEVGIWLTNFGQSMLMQVTNVSYRMPVLMIFTGYVDGVESTLVQHVNQLSFLITSVPKEPNRPKHKIGFLTEPEEE